MLKQTGQVQKADDQVAHTHQIINESQNLALHVKGMILEQRGFLLTGDAEIYKVYEEKKALVSNHIAALKELTANNPSQVSRVDEIQHNYFDLAQKLEEAARSFAPSPSYIPTAGIREVEALKNNINRLSYDLLEEEYSYLEDRIKNIEIQRDQYIFTFIVGGGIAAFLLILLNIFLMRAQVDKGMAERDLKETEDRLRLALEGTNDGIFDWDLKTNKIVYSDQYWRMLGYRPDQFTDDYESYKRLIHSEDIGRVEERIKSYLDGIVSEYSIAFRIRHASGQWLWVNSRAKAVYDENGKPIRLVGAHMDINYIKAYEEKLKESKERAEAANQAKTEFLAHMSHEIRTPLTAISGIAEILAKNMYSFEPRQQKLIGTLGASTESLIDLVNDILDFSKIESGQIDLEETKFSLHKLFEQVISIVAVKAHEKRLEFKFDFEDLKTTQICGDRTRLRQILVNLIGNAIKFTENGRVFVRAYRTAWKERPGIRIDIEDTGIGIAPENMGIIFERFRQADSSVSRKFGGSGLGLPISLSLAQLMGGDILVASELSKGSTFSLILPLGRVELSEDEGSNTDAARDRQQIKKGVQPRKIGKDQKILLVEDYDGNIIMLSYILESMECSFDVARTGVEAISLNEQNDYQLILMDIQMPQMDGLTAAKEIRAREEKNKKKKHVPIIGMTAHATIGDKNKCLAAGMDAYLPKPIVESDLRALIYEFLGIEEEAA